MQSLMEYSQRLISSTSTEFIRPISETIHWQNRMLGLVGPRGVGKTTLFLQCLKTRFDSKESLYISADNMYFGNHTLFDTADEFARNGGKRLFIDEIHKYKNWSQELKMMYDLIPDIHVYFTGSSILDLKKGGADLSRRAPIYTMQGLSFREYLCIELKRDVPVYTLDDLLLHAESIPGVNHPLPLFKQYLQTGYYPYGHDEDFQIRLDQAVSQTLEVDIPQFSNMTFATGQKLKTLMAIISQQVPFKPNFVKLGGQIGANRNVMESYLSYMERAQMITRLREKGGLGTLGKVEKVYLDNTNLLYALSDNRPDIGTVRETFFLNQTRVGHTVTTSPISDFEIDSITFEVGGRNKTGSQIVNASQGYIVRDDIEFGYGNVIPLWAFGLLY